VALSLPTTYVFEGLRGVVLDNVFRGDDMLRALALNAFYFVLCYAAFHHFLERARIHGSLVQMGE
jgi:ABC-2 type transport system permease protein